jgi:hypothetical protein
MGWDGYITGAFSRSVEDTDTDTDIDANLSDDARS